MAVRSRAVSWTAALGFMTFAARRGRRLHGDEISLLPHAMRLCWLTRRVHSMPLTRVVQCLLRARFLPSGAELPEAERAAARACNLMARLRLGCNTCLTRCLVVGAMLSDREGLVLHVGFRPDNPNGEGHAGHAWLTLDECQISEFVDQHNGAEAEVFVEALRLPLRRMQPLEDGDAK